MVCLTFPRAHPDIFWVSPKHTAAAPSLLGPATHQTSAAGTAVGKAAAAGAWDTASGDVEQGAAQSSAASPEESPAGRKTSFCTAPALF